MKKILKGVTIPILLLISVASWAQNKTITGKVTNEKGDPIEHATVLAKNTKIGTSTNANGDFTISIPVATTTLVVTSIGYEAKQVAVIGNHLEILMNTLSSKLDEVIVNVGYGTQKRSVVTGAISKVSARDLEKVPSGRIETALQGRVSGVTVMQNSGQPGSSSKILLRGVTTFGDGGNNPLWVVDGVVVDAGGIGYINQSDIESIEVLKDATSAAIYGTRAATGVILITTKKGKAGKLTIAYNGYVGTSAPAKVLNLLNATQYAAIMNEASVASGGNVLYNNIGSLGLGTDWQKAIFNTNAHKSNHEVSLSGGTDKSTFYMSFGYQNTEGIVATDISSYQKYSFRLNTTQKIAKIFTLAQTVGYTHAKSKGIGNTNSEFGGPLSSTINLDPITPIYETDPVKLANASLYPVATATTGPAVKDANGNVFGISYQGVQEESNPLAYVQTRLGQYNWSDDVVGSLSLEAAITKNIKVKSQLSGKLAYWGYEGFTPVSFLGSGGGLNIAVNNLNSQMNKGINWNIENFLTYAKGFNNHNISVLLGQGAYVSNIANGTSYTLSNLPTNNYKDASFGFGSSSSVYTASAYNTNGNTNNNVHKLASLFARLNYNYKEKYLLTGLVRRDGSNRFGANNKYGNFTGASAGWIVSKENFWINNNIINSLKIRGGYGVTGNDAIREYGYLSLVTPGFNYPIGNTGAITTGYAPASLDNPDLKWETTNQINFGFEAQILSSLNITVDYYKKRTKGILRSITIPGYVGVTTAPVGNISNMDNSGLEVELGYKKRIGKVNFSASGNFATLKNNVTYISPDSKNNAGNASFQNMGTVTLTAVGHSYNEFFGYKSLGIFQNMAEINAYTNAAGGLIQPNARPGDFKWADLNGDGKITTDDNDKTFLGSSLPKITFGLTLSAEYMAFDIMAFANGAAGNKIFQGLRRLDIAKANYQTDVLSRWTGEGTSTKYPRLTFSDPNGNFGKMSDFYLEKGDFLRLKILQFGYTLPANKVLNKIGANKLRIYVTAENLFTLTNYTGYDPEVGGAVFGIDKGQYPQARSFVVGAQLQF